MLLEIIWLSFQQNYKIQDCNAKIVKYNDGDNELIFYDDVVTVTAKAPRILNSIT